MEKVLLSVSDFIALTNQTLEYAYPSIEIEGEVASFKVNQGKYVFFDLKDAGGSVGCFMTVWQLRIPIEDGMKVIVRASPKLTPWGKFSLTVHAMRPSGEGALKKSFELLKAKLETEGLFAPERKRSLPAMPRHIAVIGSKDSAGYADFMKIISDRWGGVRIDVAHTQVQGSAAPDQIIRALEYVNQQEILPEAIVIIRGGGSADDLSAFNDELLVRAVAGSRVPVVAGIGHEVDETLVDFAADLRAATPSNAAQLVVPDKNDVLRALRRRVSTAASITMRQIDERQVQLKSRLQETFDVMEVNIDQSDSLLGQLRRAIRQVDPELVLRRGYAIIRGEQKAGQVIAIETSKAQLTARIETYDKK